MESEDISGKKKMVHKNILGVIITSGILAVLAFALNHYFIVLPEQKEKALKQVSLNLSENYLCDRKEPYEMPEEFIRALSLIKQRWTEYGQNQVSSYIDSYEDCLNIQYGDLRMVGGAEGAFWFDETISSPDNLQITIDNIYKFNDDLLTAIVLQHEIVHALNFISDKRDGVKTNCIESEQKAFTLESAFIKTLNQGEKDSIIQRYLNLQAGLESNQYSTNFFLSLQDIIGAQQYSLDACSSNIKNGKITKEKLNSCRIEIEYAEIKKILEKYDYCNEGLVTENTSTNNSIPINNTHAPVEDNTAIDDAIKQQEEANEKYAKEQKKQYEAQLKLDKKAYNNAIDQVTTDYNNAVASLNASKTNEINQTISMLSSAGQTSGSEQYQQYIERIVDSYEPQFDNAEKIYQSNLKAIKATKYW